MKRLLLLSIGGSCTLLLCALPLRSGALESDTPNWTNPSRVTIRTVIPAHIPDRYRTLQTENHECQDMMEGCFVQTAFGLQDAESNRAIFNGTSGAALPLIPHSGGQVLVGWPRTDTVLALTSIPTGGVQIGIYRAFTAVLADRLNIAGQITGKQVTRGADLILSDNASKKLVFNPNTLAFSDNGSWLVAETQHAGFVRINAATLDVVSITPGYSSLSSSLGLKESQLAISDSGQFVAIANRTAGVLNVHDLSRCSSSGCASHDYVPFLTSQLPSGFIPVHLRFLNSGLLSFRTLTGQLEASYLLAPTDHIDSLLSYLGLGDSFAAGQGVEPYRAGTNTAANNCHLSELSYPMLVRNALFTSIRGNSVACSGARIHNIEADKPPAVTPAITLETLRTFTPGILPQSAFVSHYQPAIITAEIGGNDIGFGDIIAECVIPKARSNTSCYNTYEDRLEIANLIDRTMPRLTQLYKKLKSRAPLGKLYAVGYPQVVTSGNCAVNVQLDASEIQFAISVVDQLNAAIAEAAKRAGANYIDVSQAFVGHRFCETDSSLVAMNGITYGGDAGFVLPKSLGGGKVSILSGGSYHPNELGQRLLSQVIIGYLRGTVHSAPAVYKPAISDALGLLNAQKTNRTASNLQFARFTKSNNPPGLPIAINLPGLGLGLKPNMDYEVRLDGPAGSALGTIRTDPGATLIGLVPLPMIHSGGYTVDIIGPNHAGEVTDIRQVITVEEPLVENSAPEEVDTKEPQQAEAGPGSNGPAGSSGGPDIPVELSSAMLSGIPIKNEQQQSQVLGAATQNPQSGLPQTMARPTTTQATTIANWPALQKVHWLRYFYLAAGVWIAYVSLRIFGTRSFGRPPFSRS